MIGAVGQAEREAMLESQRDGIAKAKREGRYKGRVPTARRQADEIMPVEVRRASGHRKSPASWGSVEQASTASSVNAMEIMRLRE